MAHLKLFISLCISLSISLSLKAQEFVEQTFFSPRTGIGHSCDITEKGYLNFSLFHRMGRISSGPSELFGLNQASSLFALDYGITNTLMAGFSAGSLEKNFSGFAKFKILRQSTGERATPLTVSLLSQMEVRTGPLSYPQGKYYTSSRFYYVNQLVFARKFNETFSAQFSPVAVHRNMVEARADKNTVFLAGFGARYKVKRKMAITADYFYLLPKQIVSTINNEQAQSSFSAGVEFFTGKHSFQLFVTNAVAPNERLFMAGTSENPFKKGLHIGFNITRLFHIVNYYE